MVVHFKINTKKSTFQNANLINNYFIFNTVDFSGFFISKLFSDPGQSFTPQ
jgi:hypothetical protein